MTTGMRWRGMSWTATAYTPDNSRTWAVRVITDGETIIRPVIGWVVANQDLDPVWLSYGLMQTGYMLNDDGTDAEYSLIVVTPDMWLQLATESGVPVWTTE